MVDIVPYNLARYLIQHLTIKHAMTAQIYVDLPLQHDGRVIDGGNDHVFRETWTRASATRLEVLSCGRQGLLPIDHLALCDEVR